MSFLYLLPSLVIMVTNMLGLLLLDIMAPALVMDAEAKGQLNPVFTMDLDTTDMVLALSDLVLLLTLA